MNTIINALTSAGQPLMNQLAALFKSNPAVATYYTTIARWVFVGLAVFILLTCIRSLLAGKNPSEIWAYLSLPDGSIKPLSHWENVIGRARSADVVIDIMTVSRNHATLVRDEDGHVVSTADALAIGDEVDMLLGAGSARAKITEIGQSAEKGR